MKKVLSVILSFLLIMGSFSIIPVLANAESTPLNLIVNGDAEGGYYTADDVESEAYAGEIAAGNAYGWRTNQDALASGTRYGNFPVVGVSNNAAKPAWLDYGIKYSNYSGEVFTLNVWGQTAMQDVTLKAGKSYKVSAKITVLPVKANMWYGNVPFDFFFDEKVGTITKPTLPSGKSYQLAKGDMLTALNAECNRSDITTWETNFAKDGVTAYTAQKEFTDYSFVFSADDFLADHTSITHESDGTFKARFCIYNPLGTQIMVDDVSIYEVCTITAQKGGVINADSAFVGETVSLTATPEYGNTFAGWYDEDGLVTASTTYNGTINGDMVAKFNTYNLISGGDFETNADALVAGTNTTIGSGNSGNNVVTASPTLGTAANGNHGDKALYCVPTAASNTTRYLAPVTVTVEPNTDYVFHFNYYTTDTNVTEMHFAVNTANGFSGAWVNNAVLGDWSLFWRPENDTHYGSWPGKVGYDGSTFTNNTRLGWYGSGAAYRDNWVDVWFRFNSGDDATLFTEGDNYGKLYFFIGAMNSQVNSFYLDNISLTEAVSSRNTAVTAVASEGGSVAPVHEIPATDIIRRYDTDGTTLTVGEVSTYTNAVEGTRKYSNVPTVSYTATPNTGYKFVCWKDANGNTVSTNATETFLIEGTYTAHFSVGVSATEGGYLVKNDDGSVTAVSLFGNAFLGWFDDDTLITTEPTIANGDTVSYTAKFAAHNQIPDGDFEAGTGLDFWNDSWVAAMSLSASNGMNDDTGLKITTKSDSMLGVRVPVTVKKNGRYSLNFNMNINSYTPTGTAAPVFAVMLCGSPDGTNNWGKWPQIGHWKITVRSVADPSKYMFCERTNYHEDRQLHIDDIFAACGSGWLEFNLDFTMGDSTANSYVGDLFAESDTATMYLGFSCNKTASDINYDNFSFYEVDTEVKYDGKENVRLDKVGTAPVAPGVEYKFRLTKTPDTTVTSVKFNGTPITDTNGIYSVTLTDDNTISVTTDKDADYTAAGKDFDGKDLTSWNYDHYTTPLWEGDTVYQESVIFYKGRTEAKLLYPIDKIVSVRSADMKMHYVRGVDFEVVDGKLVKLEGSSFPEFAIAPLLDSSDPNYSSSNNPASDMEGYKVGYYWAYDSFPNYVHVTYTHSKTWPELNESGYSGIKQNSLLDQMPNVAEKLENGEDVHLVFYGDSMTSGMSASGGLANTFDEANNGTFDTAGWYVTPYVPNWMTIFVESLRREYPESNITWENLSSVGKTAEWGNNNIAARWALLDKEPDLFLIGWGINDDGTDVATETYKTNVQGIVDKVKSYNSETSIMLYGGSGVNDAIAKYDWATLRSFAAALKEIDAANDNVAATDFTEIFMNFASGLETCDIFADNTVHANDFGGRVYSSVMLGALSAPESNIDVTDARVTLSESISLEYKLDGDKLAGYTDIRAEFTTGSLSAVVTEYTTDANGDIIFSFNGLNPKNAGDTVTAVYYGTKDGVEEISETYRYSIAKYCIDVIETYSNTNEDYDEVIAVCKGLLNYAAASQTYFNHNPEGLVNEGYENYTAGRTYHSATAFTANEGENKATFMGAGLSFTDTVALRINVAADDVTGLYTVISDGQRKWKNKSFQATGTDGRYYVYFYGLDLTEMSKEVTFTVYNKKGEQVSDTLTYSIESYAASKTGKGGAIENLVNTMMNYGDAVKALAESK